MAVLPPPPSCPLKPIGGRREYIDVAQKMLFSKDRNPNVSDRASASAAGQAAAAGAAGLLRPDDVRRSGGAAAPPATGAQKSYHVGDKVGPFQAGCVRSGKNRRSSWNGKTVERKLEDLKPKETAPAPRGARGPRRVPAAQRWSCGQSRSPLRDRSQLDCGQGTVGVDMGGGFRGCVPGDTTPRRDRRSTAIRKWFRKACSAQSCCWEQSQVNASKSKSSSHVSDRVGCLGAAAGSATPAAPPQQPAPAAATPPAPTSHRAAGARRTGADGRSESAERFAHRGDRSARARSCRSTTSWIPTIVKGGVTLNTYGDPRNLDARNLLDQILRINGFGMVQDGGLYRIVPLKEIAHQPLRLQREIERAEYSRRRSDHAESGLPQIRHGGRTDQGAGGVHGENAQHDHLRAGQSAVHPRQPPQHAPHHGADQRSSTATRSPTSASICSR